MRNLFTSFIRSDAFLVFVFLFLAFGGAYSLMLVIPPYHDSAILELTPYVVLVLGLALAISAARRVYQRMIHGGKEAGLYCEACGYNLGATPDRCPECGRRGTARQLTPASRTDAIMRGAIHFAWIAFIAVIAAGVIMMHVMFHVSPPSGH